MKIVCEACQAKYSISDDKVRGKAFKIRCKKCSHIIVVRSAEGGSGASPLPGEAGAVPAASESSWHIVVDGEQVGPLSASDVRARLARGEITGETYTWREGMADWLKISAVSELAESAQVVDDSSPFPNSGATTVYPPGTAEGAFAGPSGGDADVFAAPTTVSSAMKSDLFASSVNAAPEPSPSPSPASSFSFGAAPAAHTEGSGPRLGNGAGAPGGLTGQRHENSVLFSLSNLEALAGPSSAASSAPLRPGVSAPTEGSGLIDIRSMAAMTLGGSGHDSRQANDLPTFGAPQFSPVAPVLLPIGPASGPPKWMYAVLGVLVLLAGSLGVIAVRMMSNRPAAPAAVPVAVAPAAPVPAAAPPTTAAPPVTPPPSATEPLPPREHAAGMPPVAAAKSGDHPAHAGKAGRHATHEAAPAERTVAAAPAEPVDKPNTGKADKLDDLLNAALGSKPAKPAAATAARSHDDDEQAAPKKLSSLQKEDIVKGMQPIGSKVRDCYSQYKVPGTAMVNVSVGRGGRVSSAAVTGKFAGTPTGTCVESAVKSAHFPPVDATNFTYPFPLH